MVWECGHSLGRMEGLSTKGGHGCIRWFCQREPWRLKPRQQEHETCLRRFRRLQLAARPKSPDEPGCTGMACSKSDKRRRGFCDQPFLIPRPLRVSWPQRAIARARRRGVLMQTVRMRTSPVDFEKAWDAAA